MRRKTASTAVSLSPGSSGLGSSTASSHERCRKTPHLVPFPHTHSQHQTLTHRRGAEPGQDDFAAKKWRCLTHPSRAMETLAPWAVLEATDLGWTRGPVEIRHDKYTLLGCFIILISCISQIDQEAKLVVVVVVVVVVVAVVVVVVVVVVSTTRPWICRCDSVEERSPVIVISYRCSHFFSKMCWNQ